MLIASFILYQVLQLLLAPFIFFYLLYRLIKKKPTIGVLAHRLGFVPRNVKLPAIWVHAVSVGETLAAEYFIQQLSTQGQTVYLTSGTAGARQVSKHFQTAYSAYLPFDFLPCILLAFWRIRPNALIILEGEWWPNLIMVAKLLHIPIYGLNARVTQRQGIRALLFKIISGSLLRHVTRLFVQTQKDATLFKNAGVPTEALEVLGNIKAYNVAAKRHALKLIKKNPPWPVLMIGSVHVGEIKDFLGSYAFLKLRYPRLKCIIVPRHLHWLEELIELASEHGHTFVLKSKPDETFLETLATHDIIVGGALGIMFELYAYASLFYLGGTFVTVGGHNLLEPAVWGIASLVGPHHQNCLDTLQHLRSIGAGFVAPTASSLQEQSTALLANLAELEERGAAAGQWLALEAAECEKALKEFAQALPPVE